MRRRGFRAWLALTLLLLWQAPAIATIGVHLHLADHHAHESTPSCLAWASHGHEHDVDAPPHDHVALATVLPTFGAAEDAATVAAPTFAISSTFCPPTATVAGRASPGAASPREILHRNCTLLL